MDKQIGDLNSSDENVRLEAIRALIARPDPRARDGLLKCLDDEELSIRREALQALDALVKTLPDPAILDGVLKAEPHSDTVIEVAQLMALFGEKAVIRLQKEIDQTDSRRAMQAAWALREIGKVGWLALIESAAKADTRTLHILRDALEGIEDPDLYSFCYQMLEQGNLQQRFFANDILKDEILSPEWLEKTLLNEDMFIRIKGLNAFRVVSPPNAKPVVEKSIKTASGPVAYLVKDIGKLALTSLSFADKDWIDIVPSLFTGAQPVREGATWALAQRAQFNFFIVPFLTLALRDYDSYIWRDATWALIYLDGFEAYPEIYQRLEGTYTDTEEGLVFQAARQFGNFRAITQMKESAECSIYIESMATGSPTIIARGNIAFFKEFYKRLQEEWWKPTRDSSYRLELNLRLARGGDGRGVSELISAYPRCEDDLKIVILRHLGQINTPEAASFLRSLLFTEAMPVLWQVCLALGAQRPAAGTSELASLVLDRDEKVRLAAVIGLGLQANPIAMPTLMGLDKDAKPAVRAMAVWAVSRCTPKSDPKAAASWMMQTSHDAEAWVRLECLHGMRTLSYRWPVNDLIRLLQDTCPPVQVLALKTAEKQPDETFCPVLETIRGGEVGRHARYTRERLTWLMNQWRKNK